MSGQWIEDPTTPSGWRYDDTPSDPSVTSMLPVYAAPDVAPVITAGGPLDLIDCTCMPPENEHQHGGTG